MDIKALEKLKELKDKEIITEEEFNFKKKELLNSKDSKEKTNNKKQGINWKNIGLSFLVTLGFILLTVSILIILGKITNAFNIKGVFQVILITAAVIMAIVSYVYETKKYKNSAPAWAVLIVLFLLNTFGIWGVSLGIWVVSYDILQIKSGLKELKPEKVK